MTAVSPIKDKHQLKLARKWISRQPEIYQAIYHIGMGTGLRTTDITELTWADIDLQAGIVTVRENKGTRAAQARSKGKVLTAVKDELLILFRAIPDRFAQVQATKAKDILTLVPESMLQGVSDRLEQAAKSAKPKIRKARLCPLSLKILRNLKARNSSIDGGQVFSRRTMKHSNRARTTGGVISRQAVYRLFKHLELHLVSISSKAVIKLGAHSARKTAAWCLYKATGHNIALVMTAFGWSSEALVLRYLGIAEDEELEAFTSAFW